MLLGGAACIPSQGREVVINHRGGWWERSVALTAPSTERCFINITLKAPGVQIHTVRGHTCTQRHKTLSHAHRGTYNRTHQHLTHTSAKLHLFYLPGEIPALWDRLQCVWYCIVCLLLELCEHKHHFLGIYDPCVAMLPTSIFTSQDARV